jgi:hypothetical protein
MHGNDERQEMVFSYVSGEEGFRKAIPCGPSGRWWIVGCGRWPAFRSPICARRAAFDSSGVAGTRVVADDSALHSRRAAVDGADNNLLRR